MKRFNKLNFRALAHALISPAGITWLFIVVYLTAVMIQGSGGPLELVQFGSDTSEGYDGQYVYYIALDPDPEAVSPFLDVPAYRYQRILLPILARVMSIGNPALIPWLLPAINLFVHTTAVWLLGLLFQFWGLKRWHALPYGLWAGLLYSFRLDLPEPLAFGLVIAAIYFGHKNQRWVAWLFFAFALFAKETAIFFVAGQLLVYFLKREWRALIGLSLMALVPFSVFQLWLGRVFGQSGLASGGADAAPLEWIPFNGIWQIGSFSLIVMLGLFLAYSISLLLPALWGTMSALRRWRVSGVDFSSTAVLANAAIYPFLPFLLYSEPIGVFRFASGLVLALLVFSASNKNNRTLKYSYFWLVLSLMPLSELVY
ncbi:MAG: hypothetical protein O3B43_05520 [Chloroflexi bacterium]|nr:hypothetical protein [Chloroflexota bacterium]